MKKILFALLASVLVFSSVAHAESIKIGFNIPLTGDIPDVGESSKNAAEMLLKQINDAGGIDVGGTKYTLEFVYEDNESKAESALSAARKLVTQDDVLGIIGPQSSKQAVPAGEAANDLETPMISPWSTNPDTTKDRPFVFRGCFLDPFQGPVVVNFASDEFGATKAAVLYDIASDYPKGLAEVFKEAWEKKHGAGSVVAFETFTTKDVDFSAQLTNIVNSDAEILFVPQYYNEVPLIVKQAQSLGWDKPIIGGDAWAGGDLMSLCGDDCKGYFFSTHYAAAGAQGATKEFIEDYKAIYDKTPDDVAALTWDSTNLMLEAIQATGGLTGDIDEDRIKVKDALGTIKDFKGITGNMTFTPEGDPIKCAVVVKINDAGEFSFYKQVCP
ncbi:ABC transporter substrate-binding protein [Oceanidesulfovibrio marinus]|uniref:ABC transporter substrate-binding protein n=1 Tax=Oceanidesulfovibrio marinus TaxID=370038 RepID=A0A6P1ZF97_9BACT|nr:ABC transporter substrate-binding protein [Oceanidesulfovibrio marinus]QJT09265.1 ABC transporter substrate-binding protein [Oceanidesulfovibrio marinus]TVM32760.1 branched-chain amino acid ABC transporter substrate-binding protein [Oceanidesulfovibrio marinus]